MLQPDKSRDDALFADLFPLTGDKAALAVLMGVDPPSVTQQLDPNNRRRSYFHCGKLALTAAYHFDKLNGGNRGETLWRDLCAWRERLLGRARPERSRFPSTLAFQVIDRETSATPEELERVPLGLRLGSLNELIASLEEYRDHLAAEHSEYFENAEVFRGEGGPKRATSQEADAPRPVPVAARG